MASVNQIGVYDASGAALIAAINTFGELSGLHIVSIGNTKQVLMVGVK